MYGIGSLLIKNARFYPQQMAVADTNANLNYQQLNTRVNQIAHFLLAHNLGKGHRIGFICENCVEFVEMWLATQKTGTVAVLLNYRTTQCELSHDLRRAKCEALFCSESWQETVSAWDRTDSPVRIFISYGNIRPGFTGIDSICTQYPAEEPNIEIMETDWSTILFTSGSTGISKGVVRTHRMVMAYAMQMAAENEYYKTERICILSHSPLFHTGGLSMLMKSLALGGSYIGINNVRPEIVAPLIEEYQVTQLFLVPPVNIMRLIGSEEMQKRDLSSVNFIWATGGKLSLEYVLEMIRLFPRVRIKTSYGGTEFCAACSISYQLSEEQARANPQLLESAGTIGQFVDVRLVDEGEHDVPIGEVGELWVQSSFVMLEYLDMPEETAGVMTDGWYHTGDLFYMDENGLLYFVDRKSSMIKSGGENVYPNEVESVIRRHPCVIDCAVVSHPDAKWGEAVAAAIVPAMGFNLSDIIAFVRNNLAGFRKPLYYLVVENLPVTGSGKTDRKALRDFEKYPFVPVERILSKDLEK